MVGGPPRCSSGWSRSSRRSRPASSAAPRTEGRTGAARAGRARLPPLRPGRRRPLREDGAQRDRVRVDGRLRRRAQRPARRRSPASSSATPTRRRRRSIRPSTTATRSTLLRWPRSGGEAASSPRGCSTSPPRRWPSRPAWTDSRVACPIRARGAGRRSRRSRRAIPTPVLTAALYARFASRGEDDFANRVLSAMRLQFGGHVEKPS